jgi:Zn-dependent protease
MFGVPPFYLGHLGIIPVYIGLEAIFTVYLAYYWTQAFPSDQRTVIFLILLACMLFSILLHELGHALVARTQGMHGIRITIGALGGYCSYHGDRRPGREALISVAGPLTNFAIAGVAWLSLRYLGLTGELTVLSLTCLLGMNLALGIFNSLPIYPLDGGQTTLSLTQKLGMSAAKARRFTLSLTVATAVVILVFGSQYFSGMLFLFILATLLLTAFRDLR